MADTLTQLITKVQAQLADNGTLFPAGTCTAALRQALADVNAAAPQNAAVLVTAAAGQKEYELSDEDPEATGITDVLLQGANEYIVPLPYNAYVEDGRWFFRVRCVQAEGHTLVVRYSKPHTISGLDGAADSTLPEALNTAVVNGGAYFASLLRAAAGVESNNVQPNVTDSWLRVAYTWKSIFENNLSAYRRQPLPRGEPSTAAWNDEWH